jgi:hypothetical protein
VSWRSRRAFDDDDDDDDDIDLRFVDPRPSNIARFPDFPAPQPS